MHDQQVRTPWGTTKRGGFPALGVAIPAGLALAAALGVVAAAMGATESNPMLGGVVFALGLALPLVALVYAVVVDRGTIKGAADRPEESVESGWYDRAAAGAFTDLVLLAGAGATILAFIPANFPVDLKLVLPAVVLACFASFGIRYLLLRHRG